MFAEVAFPISNFQTFTYTIPKELKKEVQLGSRVQAPFGKRNCQGIILSIKNKTSYSGTTSLLSYKTNSQTAYGPIAEFEITDGGKNYYSVPGITTITSALGRGAIAEASSTNIGEIVKTKINDIGFDFPSDKTLNPSLSLSQTLEIIPLMLSLIHI